MNDNFYILLLISVAGVAMIIISFILLQVRNRNSFRRRRYRIKRNMAGVMVTILSFMISILKSFTIPAKLKIGSGKGMVV